MVPGPFGTDDQASVVVDALAVTQQDHGILEILGVNRQRVLAERPLERVAAVDRYAPEVMLKSARLRARRETTVRIRTPGSARGTRPARS